MEHIVQSQSILKIQTLQSNSIYLICEQSNKIPHTSVGEQILQEKTGGSIVWNNVCKNIYKTTIEPHLREFQLKIIPTVFCRIHVPARTPKSPEGRLYSGVIISKSNIVGRLRGFLHLQFRF